ncbi:Peroxidase [Mycena sanguinolenta]|uniref:Peroxidase n=1 Tax=Mycena sanguinolenta TaxID=230812 RepID=A0A8H7CSP5_9AGAR|nr:Peroxidase [Mycena sanguinolenta]
MIVRFIQLLVFVQLVRGDYHWPSPLIDQLEGLLYEGKQEGLPDRVVDLLAQLNGCIPQDNNGSTAAEWIRFAYHDMATHNIDDGTGGLDNSINVGGDLEAAMFDFIDFPNKYLFYSDVTAIGVVLATVGCGGPVVALRGGRIDASSAGPPGVPTPDQSLDDFIESFRKQGFTQEEMIALVACGHTVGGVHNPDFPTLVPPGNIQFEDNIVLFDGTPQFDNAIVTQYLDGTTDDLLVIGANGNSTLSSDLRVFSSDGNVTMQSLASPENFASTCATLLGRMIDTVPSNVTLTDGIQPLPVKVAGVQLAPGQDDTLVLNLTLRLLSNTARQVTLHWADRDSTTCASGTCSASPTNSALVTTPLVGALGLSPIKYTFSTPIADTSIGTFWFEVDGQVENNGGSGYAIEQDRVLFVPGRSTLGASFTIVAAVRNDSVPSRVYINPYQRDTIVIRTASVNLTLDASIPPAAGYNFYSGSVFAQDFTFDLFAEIDGMIYEEEFRDTHWIPSEFS